MKDEPKVEEPKVEDPKVESQPEISFNFDEPKVVEEKVAPLQEEITTKIEEKPVVSVDQNNDEFQKRINYLQDENQRLYSELDRITQDIQAREMTRADDLEKHNAMLQEQVSEKDQEIEALKAKLNELKLKPAEETKAVDAKEEKTDLPSNGTTPSTVSVSTTGDVVNITTTAPTVEVKPNTDATVVISPNDATENRVILGGLNETIIKPRAGQKNNENIIKPATVLVTNSPEKVLKDRVVIKSNDKSPVADAKGIKAEDKKAEEAKPQKDNFGREVRLEKGVVEAISNGIIWVKIGNNYSIYKSGDKTPEGRIIGLVDENVGAFDQDGHLIWKK